MQVLKFSMFSHWCIGNWKGCQARVNIQEFNFPEIRNAGKGKCMPSLRNRVEIESESSSTKMRRDFKALHTNKKYHWLGGIERIVAVAKFKNELVEYLSRAMAVMLNVDIYTDTPWKNIGQCCVYFVIFVTTTTIIITFTTIFIILRVSPYKQARWSRASFPGTTCPWRRWSGWWGRPSGTSAEVKVSWLKF